MDFIFGQKIFIAAHYFVSTSSVLCQGAFQDAFPNETVPNKLTVHCLIWKFHENGSVSNWKNNFRPTVLSNYTLEDMRLSLVQFSAARLC
jgi:hypothetical protein